MLRFERENFWEMGETGPCGPCSEIHLDRGPAACDRQGVAGHTCQVNGDCARYIELWNLVFIQYNREPDQSLRELPSKHVDTGMGLERIVAVLQNVLSNYDTDLFRGIIDATESLARRRYGADPEADISFRVIADHARAVSIMIADHVLPSNEGRGYVLRRVLRRAARHGKMLGLDGPFLTNLVEAVAQILGDAYPELRRAPERSSPRSSAARRADSPRRSTRASASSRARSRSSRRRPASFPATSPSSSTTPTASRSISPRTSCAGAATRSTVPASPA